MTILKNNNSKLSILISFGIIFVVCISNLYRESQLIPNIENDDKYNGGYGGSIKPTTTKVTTQSTRTTLASTTSNETTIIKNDYIQHDESNDRNNNAMKASPLPTQSPTSTPSILPSTTPSILPSSKPSNLPLPTTVPTSKPSNPPEAKSEWTSMIPQKMNRSSVPENLHIVFVGDSVTRYQYLNLIYYLHTGRWAENDDNPNIGKEEAFGSWLEFYIQINKIFDGKEKCDCYHAEGWIRKWETVTENRYYSDPIKNNYIAYIQRYGERYPANGHWNSSENMFDFPSNSSGNETFSLNKNTNNNTKQVYEMGFQEPLWRYGWKGTIRNHIQYLQPRPQYIVLNSGIWPTTFGNETLLKEIQNECHLLNITTIYKTTTTPIKETSKFRDEQTACRIFDRCLNLSWTVSITGPDYYTSEHHFQSSVNRLFNEQFLQSLEE